VGRCAKVDVRVWDDERVAAMTPIPPCGQGLWIRLLVSRHRSSIPGLLCAGEAALAEEFGWTLEAFREASSQKLIKADWKARVVWIPKAWKYNPPESANVVKSWRLPWDETPECDLKREAYRTLKASLEGFDKGFAEAFSKACDEPLRKPLANQEQEQEQYPEQEQKNSPARDPVAGSTGYEWLEVFKVAHARAHNGLSYGRGEQDAKAGGKLSGLLDEMPEHERSDTWTRRDAIIAEYLTSGSPRLVGIGHSFAFFVEAFSALRIPREIRPKPEPKQPGARKDGKPGMQARY
jgi:hypothetical protein